MLPLTAIFVALSQPIVALIYERGVFKSSASAIVAPVLFAYGIGMFFLFSQRCFGKGFFML